MDVRAFFSGKKVTVMRIGLLGRGVGDTRFLAEHGADILVVDDAPQSAMQSSVDALAAYSNIRFKFGPYDPEDFVHADFILQGAGAAADEPVMAAARKSGVPIKMSASWFAELAQIPFVGITGTRGKSTTTMMLKDIMEAARSTGSGQAGMHVLLGGNIRGVSTLALLPQVTKDSIGLFELDSWQCQGFGESGIAPNVGVFTTFYPDHLNYYKGSMDAYLGDKMQLFVNQKPEDTLVVGAQAVPYIEPYKNKIHAHVVITKPKKRTLKVLGEHNQQNAACAYEAARALGIDDEVIESALQNFKGVPGRLEFLKEVQGVKIYNDNNSTTPDATLAALQALGTQHTILIMGGADKKLDMSKLEARLPELKKVVRIEQGLKEAMTEALAAAAPGDTILFSPAYASFGMFRNEFDRGDQFVALVNAL